METRLLRYYVSVVDEGGVSAAANALNMTQPSLSQAIKSLERDVGVLLFRRIGRKMLLTSAGEELLQRARSILSDIERAQASMDAFSGVRKGSLVLAATANDSFYPLSKALARFHSSYPDIEVKLMPSLFGEETVGRVVSGEAELGFTPRPRGYELPAELTHYVVSSSRMYVAVSPQYRQLGDKCSIADIADIPMITRPKGTYARTLVDRATEAGIKVRVLVDSPHDSTLPRLIADGMGCAVIPLSLAMDAQMLGASVAPLDPPEEFDILFIHRADHLSPAGKRFVDDGVWKVQ